MTWRWTERHTDITHIYLYTLLFVRVKLDSSQSICLNAFANIFPFLFHFFMTSCMYFSFILLTGCFYYYYYYYYYYNYYYYYYYLLFHLFLFVVSHESGGGHCVTFSDVMLQIPSSKLGQVLYHLLDTWREMQFTAKYYPSRGI